MIDAIVPSANLVPSSAIQSASVVRLPSLIGVPSSSRQSERAAPRHTPMPTLSTALKAR